MIYTLVDLMETEYSAGLVISVPERQKLEIDKTVPELLLADRVCPELE